MTILIIKQNSAIQTQKGCGNVELLTLIPYGRENAISRSDLAKLTGWDDRKVRDEIKKLMRDGEHILSSSSAKGYWRSDDPEEIERFLIECDKRRTTEALNVEPLRFFVGKSIPEKSSFCKRNRGEIDAEIIAQ